MKSRSHVHFAENNFKVEFEDPLNPSTSTPEYKNKFQPKRSSKLTLFIVLACAVLILNLILYAPTSSSRFNRISDISSIKPPLPSVPPAFPRATSQHSPNNSLNNSPNNVHLIFSTDCGLFQTWQSYALFHRALVIHQPGHITRIASGCESAEQQQMQTWHDDFISPMSPNFHVHFTPKFDGTSEDGKSGKTYSFFNKPYGLLHWLENNHIHEDVIVVLLDPDNFLLKPIVNDFSDTSSNLVSHPRAWSEGKGEVPTRVSHGTPFGQKYGLGSGWKKFNLHKITSDPGSPAISLSAKDANTFYPVGPPYLFTARDALKIAKKWVEFVRPVNEEYPHLLGEMYAYCIAAAHLNLPHVMLDSLMVSNVGAHEGWKFVDDLDKQEICAPNTVAHNEGALPNVLHFCQMYRMGEFAFHKRKIPRDIFTCEHPLMEAPPAHLVSSGEFNYKTQGDKSGAKRGNLDLTSTESVRNGFLICNLVQIINEAAIYFKEQHCVNGEKINFEKTWNHHKLE